MARTIKGDPKNYAEAVYLLDRNQISVQGARTRDAALKELRKEFKGGGSASADDTEEETEELSDDYADWNMDQLKEELADRDLSTSGNKADLVARLEEDDEEEADF